MKTILMPKGGDVTQEELRNAIWSHLAVITPDKYDDQMLDIAANACVKVVEDMINFKPPRENRKFVYDRKRNAQKRARRGGLPVLNAEAHFAIDGMIQLYETMAANMIDTPEWTPIVNEFLRLAKISKAWIDSQPLPAEENAQ